MSSMSLSWIVDADFAWQVQNAVAFSIDPLPWRMRVAKICFDGQFLMLPELSAIIDRHSLSQALRYAENHSFSLLAVVSEVLSGKRSIIRNRLLRSTHVNKGCRCPEKCMRSASQCPTSALVWALVGRKCIGQRSGIGGSVRPRRARRPRFALRVPDICEASGGDLLGINPCI